MKKQKKEEQGKEHNEKETYRARTGRRCRILICGSGVLGCVIGFCIYSWVMECPDPDCRFHYAPFVGMLIDGVALAVLATLVLRRPLHGISKVYRVVVASYITDM